MHQIYAILFKKTSSAGNQDLLISSQFENCPERLTFSNLLSVNKKVLKCLYDDAFTLSVQNAERPGAVPPPPTAFSQIVSVAKLRNC